MAEMREWIDPKSGRFPKNGEKVLVLLTVRYRDPFFERDGAEGKAYVSTARFYCHGSSQRHWRGVQIDDDCDFTLVNEIESLVYTEDNDYEGHPDSSLDTTLIGWRPLPEVPDDIIWPDRLPMASAPERTISVCCPACGKEFSKLTTKRTSFSWMAQECDGCKAIVDIRLTEKKLSVELHT